MKRLFAAVLVTLLVFLMVPFALAEGITTGQQVTYGVINGFTYYFDALNGKLYIRGVGEMPNFANQKAPWAALGSRVNQVVLSNGITSISEKAFEGLTSLKTVTVPVTVTVISTTAFTGCNAVQTIEYAGPAASFEQFAASSGIPELQKVSVKQVPESEIETQISNVERSYAAQGTATPQTAITAAKTTTATTTTGTKKYNKGDDGDSSPAPKNGIEKGSYTLKDGTKVEYEIEYVNGVRRSAEEIYTLNGRRIKTVFIIYDANGNEIERKEDKASPSNSVNSGNGYVYQ